MVINVIQGDWDEAALSAVGMVPVLGEFADAAKTAKVTAKVVDKVHDASKVAKFFDKTLTAMKNPKFLKKAGKFGEAIVDGIISGSVYSSDGKSFGKGFANGFTSTVIAEWLELPDDIIKRIPIKSKEALKYANRVIAGSFGSALGNIVENIMNGDDVDTTTKKLSESAAKDILASAGSAYVDYTIELANEADSVARELMNYDEKFGKAFGLFFKGLITALNSME